MHDILAIQFLKHFCAIPQESNQMSKPMITILK